MKDIKLLAALLALLPFRCWPPGPPIGSFMRARAGLGHGKHIVFLSGDEEYRSEESLPMLARILAVRHGFKCTVLFAVNPADHTIDPLILTNLPGMEALDSADLCVMALRFRELPDAQMRHFVNYLNSGKPIVALRTSTHAFAYERMTSKALMPNMTGGTRTGPAASASKFWARPGSAIMVTTVRRAPTGWSMHPRPGSRSCAA